MRSFGVRLPRFGRSGGNAEVGVVPADRRLTVQFPDLMRSHPFHHRASRTQTAHRQQYHDGKDVTEPPPSGRAPFPPKFRHRSRLGSPRGRRAHGNPSQYEWQAVEWDQLRFGDWRGLLCRRAPNESEDMLRIGIGGGRLTPFRKSDNPKIRQPIFEKFEPRRPACGFGVYARRGRPGLQGGAAASVFLTGQGRDGNSTCRGCALSPGMSSGS